MCGVDYGRYLDELETILDSLERPPVDPSTETSHTDPPQT